MKRTTKIMWGLIIAVALAVASNMTTGMNWDGGFPAGVFQLSIKDGEGRPVRNAVLRVYRGGTTDSALRYPLEDHLVDGDLVSDEDGRITTVRKNGGLQFGGYRWRLFWLIPIGAKAPQFDCEITANGFKPLKFDVWRLFESSYATYDDFPKTTVTVDGKGTELPIYEQSFKLAR